VVLALLGFTFINLSLFHFLQGFIIIRTEFSLGFSAFSVRFTYILMKSFDLPSLLSFEISSLGLARIHNYKFSFLSLFARIYHWRNSF